MRFSTGTLLYLAAAACLAADEPAIPLPVSAANYPSLLERPPFRQVIRLSRSLVLSGVASLPGGKVVTVWDRTTGKSFVVGTTPNPQGWKLAELTESSDLRSVAAIITAGDETVTLRFDPERLTPPKLDNTSKPAPRGEGAIVVEALLRSLDPPSAKDFEALPATAQEAFRKSFSEFLSAYPTASDARRLAFVHRALDEATPAEPGTTESPEAPKSPGLQAEPPPPVQK